jgi:hypothetical protein
MALAVALWALSSETLQAMDTSPGEAPVESYFADVPVPLMVPDGAE